MEDSIHLARKHASKLADLHVARGDHGAQREMGKLLFLDKGVNLCTPCSGFWLHVQSTVKQGFHTRSAPRRQFGIDHTAHLAEETDTGTSLLFPPMKKV